MAKKLPGASPSAPTTETAAAARQPFMGYGQMVKGFPRWVRPGDRRLLQAPATAIAADAVVAKDGSGGYTTVSAAVAAAPTNSKKRYVIYIKAGAYMENVEVGKKHVNLMFVGDGIGKTVIKASRNVVDGYTTFRSATVGKYNTIYLSTCFRMIDYILIAPNPIASCINRSNPILVLLTSQFNRADRPVRHCTANSL